MKKISSKLKMYKKKVGRAQIIRGDVEGAILQIMLWSFATLALLYVFFLGNMVFDIVERRTLESSTRTLGNEVSDLELAYLSMLSDVDLNLSYSLGFKETDATFATRKTLGFRSFDSIKTSQNDI